MSKCRISIFLKRSSFHYGTDESLRGVYGYEHYRKYRHISKIYGEKVIYEDASFGIQQGDKIGIVGINGTGKSTSAQDDRRGGDAGCGADYPAERPEDRVCGHRILYSR